MVKKQIKLKLVLFGGLFFISILFIFTNFQFIDSSKLSVATLSKPAIIRIAACPTYYDFVKKLDQTKYKITKT